MALVALGLILTFTACSDSDDDNYDIPSNYSFENVDYSGQTARLDMLAEMKDYIKSVTTGTQLDAGRLAAMYANEANLANWEGTYDSSKQLRNKTHGSQQAAFDAMLSAAAADSQGDVGTAAEGVAGVVTSLNGQKAYFVNAKGLEYAQIVEKGLLSACFMHQITEIYLGDGKMNVDNSTITPGKGTPMEHHWDEAFGYFGVPVDFPDNTDGIRYWGKYCNSRESLLGLNNVIMDAYIKGRAAISNNDLDTRDEQIAILRRELDKVAAATTIHYINSAITNFQDDAIKLHGLSEAVAFYYATSFNPGSASSASQTAQILTLIGNSDNYEEMDFWQTTIANLEAARTQISNIYGWEASLAQQF